MDKKEIMKKTHFLIISCINKYALNKDEFEDLYQAGALTILESIDKFDESKGVNLFYYLKKQLKYFYLNYGRYDKKIVSLNEPIGEELELGDTLVDYNSYVEEILVSHYEFKALNTAYLNLKHEDRYILEQNLIRKRTLDDLAKELNMSRTTLFRRKKKILDCLRSKII